MIFNTDLENVFLTDLYSRIKDNSSVKCVSRPLLHGKEANVGVSARI